MRNPIHHLLLSYIYILENIKCASVIEWMVTRLTCAIDASSDAVIVVFSFGGDIQAHSLV